MKSLRDAIPPKPKLIAIISFSFTLFFTVMVCVPTDLYLHNPSNFIVGWKFFITPLIVVALIGIVMLSIVLVLLWNKMLFMGIVSLLLFGLLVTLARFIYGTFFTLYSYLYPVVAVLVILWILLIRLFNDEAVDVVLLVGWGGIVSAYIQTLFLNGNMVLLTGDIAGYSSLTLGHILNIAIWIIITFLPLSLWIIFKFKRKAFRFESCLIFTMGLIIGMQLTGLVSTAVSTELPIGYEEDTPRYFSYESVLDYNVNENIIVFILDRLDVTYMEEVLGKYPELYEQLEGFTFYKNNVSEYGGTYPSVTKMLTEHYYDFIGGPTFNEYWKEAWTQRTIIDILKEYGYSTNLFIDSITTYGNLDEIQDRTDNLKYYIGLRPNNEGILKTFYRLSFGRLSHYLLKNFFLAPLVASFGNELFYIETYGGTDVAFPSVSFDNDLAFFEFIRTSEFSVVSDKKVFNFIHLCCSHADRDRDVFSNGYHYNESNGSIVLGGNYIDSTRACFEILNTYFCKLKELGIYDNSTIILVADHGALPVKTAAGLFIKPRDSSGALRIDATTELSNKYFGASVLDAAGIPHDDIGVSYFDIIGGVPPPTRTFYYYSSWVNARKGSGRLSLIDMYEIHGDVNDIDNWVLVRD